MTTPMPCLRYAGEKVGRPGSHQGGIEGTGRRRAQGVRLTVKLSECTFRATEPRVFSIHLDPLYAYLMYWGIRT
jgi:hypothetical protein